ncbi:MAG: hypothetical protein LBQ87_07725 [Candidatus Fibromonas sp.]|jgi:hypothetical protein|nr:hypothetical protein [Candidatus Fibromonas sp.]
MSKKSGIDPEYYETHCFADDLIEAKKKGNLIITQPGENTLEAIKRHIQAKEKTAVPVGVAEEVNKHVTGASVWPMLAE